MMMFIPGVFLEINIFAHVKKKQKNLRAQPTKIREFKVSQLDAFSK